MNVSIPTSANQNQEASLIIRRIQPEDAESCGRIAFEAHHVVATAHNFPPEHPSVEFSIGLMKAKIADRNAYGLVAHELAAAAGENGRTPDQARPILLAAAGGESPHAAAVWGHAAKDCGAPITSRIGDP